MPPGSFKRRVYKKGDRISIMSQNTTSFVVAYFGVLMAGGVVVPMNHKLMAPEVDYILENSGSKILLFDGALASVTEKVTSNVQKLSIGYTPRPFANFSMNFILQRTSYLPIAINDHDMCQILYTNSGTTGKPKGCMISPLQCSNEWAMCFSWNEDGMKIPACLCAIAHSGIHHL